MVKRSQAARAAAAASVSAITALVVHAGGCGGTEADAPEGGDPALADAGVDRRVPGKWTEWQPEESPSPLEGWKLLSDYPGCGFYYATDRKYLPPPVAWEPCTVVTDAANLTDAGPSGPPGMVCERMATPPNGTAPTGAYLRSVHVEGGRALLLVNRGFENGSGFMMVAEADGPVHTATYTSGACPTSGFDEARFGHFLHRVYDSSKENNVGGAIGGSFDTLKPRVYFPRGHQANTFYSHHYNVGRSLFIESTIPGRVYSFATGELVATITRAPEDQDLYYSGYRFHEDTLFWLAATAHRSAVKVWTREQGIFTLLDHDNDATRGVAGFATDGIDMVWMEGRGRTNFNSLVFDVYEHWTAKYSLDEATVKAAKRRLRSEPRASMAAPSAVGCGYAAVPLLTPTPTEWGQSGFRLIRLSDGRSWPILDGSREQQRELHFAMPLGVSCDHVYVQGWATDASRSEVVRIRIDSLGEGVAPD